MNISLATLSAPLVCALTLVALPIQATAEVANNSSFIEDVNGDARINYAGKLRMLSQRIPAAACNLHASVNPEVSGAVLEAAQAEFAGILNALENGDAEFGINSPEERRRTLHTISEVQASFAPIQAALANGTVSDEAMQTLVDQNMTVLGEAKRLVSEISGQYANPAALLQSDAMTIDIAGRQRMLTQKISKEVCQVMSGISASSARSSLGDTMSTFEVSLLALRDGMPDVGIQRPPNNDIAEGLAIVASDWAAVRDHVQTVVDGGEIDAAAREALFIGLNTTLVNMNKVVGMYSEAADLGL